MIKSKPGTYHCCYCIWQSNPLRQKQFMCGPKWLIRSCFKQLVSSYWKGKSWWNWQGHNFRLLYTLFCKAVCRVNDNLVLIVYLWQFEERHLSNQNLVLAFNISSSWTTNQLEIRALLSQMTLSGLSGYDTIKYLIVRPSMDSVRFMYLQPWCSLPRVWRLLTSSQQCQNNSF